jgi:hypothetical protein
MSAADLSIEIAEVAREVHIASRSVADTYEKQPGHDNLWLHSMVKVLIQVKNGNCLSLES